MKFIMVISRDPVLSREVEKALDSGWFKIWNCKTAKEALAMLGQQEPSLIVCDGRFELEQFSELARTMKINLGQVGLTFLLLTAQDELPPAELQRVRDSGIDDCMKWPSPLAVLGNKLRTLVDRHETNAAAIDTARTISLDDHEFGGDYSLELGSSTQPTSDFDNRSRIEMPMGEQFVDDGVVFEHGFGREAAGDRGRGRVSSNADTATLNALPDEKLEQIAARILDKKLTQTARTEIKKLIQSSVKAELNALLPEIVHRVRESLKSE